MRTVSAYVRYGSISWIVLILSESAYNWNWKTKSKSKSIRLGCNELLLLLLSYQHSYFSLAFDRQSSTEVILLAFKSFSWTVIQFAKWWIWAFERRRNKLFSPESNYFKYDDIKTYSLWDKHTIQITIELGTWLVQQMMHNSQQ